MSDAHTPTCPRCGYDQSGVIGSWTDRCPLSGICTECGLELEWSRVLDPREMDVPWSAEHARSLTQAIARTPKTILYMVLPWIYWKRLPLGAPLRIRRLCTNAAAVLFLIYVVSSLVLGYEQWNAVTMQWSSSLAQHYQRTGWGGMAGVFLNPFLMPVLEFDDIYSATTLDLIVYKDHWYWSNNFWGNGTRINIPTSTIGSSSSYVVMFFSLSAVPVLWTTILGAVPSTRERAKLKFAHIARAFLLNLSVAAAIVLVYRTGYGVYEFRLNTIQSVSPLVFLMPLIAYLVWSLVFWPSALIAGWRVKGVKSLIALGTLAGIIGTITFALLPALLF